MDAGRTPPKSILKTRPVTPAVSESAEKATRVGQSASGQKVTVVPPEKVTKAIPQKLFSSLDVQLQKRTVEAYKPGLLNRVINFVRNRPNASERSQLWEGARNIEKALSDSSHNPIKSAMVTSKNTLTVNKGSEGEKVCALMVDAGLAKYRKADDGRITISFVRPHNIEQQLRSLEALVQVVPIALNDSGQIDWEAMLTEDSKLTSLPFTSIDFLQEHGDVGSNWFLNEEATEQLEALQEKRSELQQQFAKTAQTQSQPSDNQWDIARQRLRDVAYLLRLGGHNDVASQFTTSYISRLSQRSLKEWQDDLTKVSAADAKIGALMAQVTPNYDDNLTAQEPPAVQYHKAPKNAEIRELLKKHDLDQALISQQDVDNIEYRELKAGNALLFPVKAAYAQVVEQQVGDSVKRDLTLLKLPKRNAITLARLDQSLGKVARTDPIMHAQCLDDTQRGQLLAKLKPLAGTYQEETRALEKQFKEDYPDSNLSGLFSKTRIASEKLVSEQGEDYQAAESDVTRGIDNLYEIIMAYDRVKALLVENGTPMNQAAMVRTLSEKAKLDGVQISVGQWANAIRKVPLTAPDSGLAGA